MRKLFTTIFAFALCLMLGSQSAQGASMQQMRFHCANDTTEINELLRAGFSSGIKQPEALVSFYAHLLLNRPYVAHTLEGDTEKLTINIDELDCTTFVETLYALARSTMNGRFSWRDYAHNLESLRYRGGEIGDYSSRLHYISDWSINNAMRGNLMEVTADIPGVRYIVKDINFMSKHRSSYPSLVDDEIYDKVLSFEIGYRNHRFPYIPKEAFGSKKVKQALHSGDFVGMVTKIDGLDISHMGVIEKNSKGEIYLLNASMSGGKVQIEKKCIKEYLGGIKSNVGLRVWRIKQ